MSRRMDIISPSGELSASQKEELMGTQKIIEHMVTAAKLNTTLGSFVAVLNLGLSSDEFAELLTLVLANANHWTVSSGKMSREKP